MLVVEKTRHIEAQITGTGIDAILSLIKEHFPNVSIKEECDDDEYENWDTSTLAQEIRLHKTPGKLLKAYRDRAGLSIVELAEAIGTKYPNISAMENDRRVIGLAMAKKLGKVLKVDFHTFLN